MGDIKNLTLDIGTAKQPCAVFGKGKRWVIMLPGVGDGLTTTEGKAAFFALSYPDLRRNFRVLMLSRRIPLPEKFSTEQMADDVLSVMDKLGIEKASFIGVSMGGMIAQHFGAKYPERTEKIVLAVTAAKKTDEMDVIHEWLSFAEKGDGVSLMRSSVKNMYSEKYYKKNGWLCEITGRFIPKKNYSRFKILCDACLEHDASSVLKNIKAPVLIIGGGKDSTVGGGASVFLSKNIPGAKLLMYKNLGHGLYDEASDFIERICDFLI